MLPQRCISPRWLLLGPKELFFFFVTHFAHFNRWRKARQNIRQFCIARGFWAGGGGKQRAAEEGRYPHQSPSKEGFDHSMAGPARDICASPFSDGLWSFWLRQPEISSALPQRFLRFGNVFSFRCGRRTKFFKHFPEMDLFFHCCH